MLHHINSAEYLNYEFDPVTKEPG